MVRIGAMERMPAKEEVTRLLIEWKGVPTEEWCRYILQTSDGYYAARSDSVGTERVYKLEIKK